MLPPNLYRIEIHYRPGAPANTLYEIAFTNAVTDVRVYTRCNPLADGCVYEPAREVWNWIVETNRGRDPVSLAIRATDEAGTTVGQSATISIRFSRDLLRGVLYYWTTSAGSGIMRWNFGDATQTDAERFVGPENASGRCVGCHALFRDGKKMVVSTTGGDTGQLLLWNVVTRKAIAPFPLRRRT